MTLSVLSVVIASAALVVAGVVVGQSRTDAGNCARDARSAADSAAKAAKAARAAAESAAKVGAMYPVPTAETTEQGAIPPGALAPTIELDTRRLAREQQGYR